ncbi:MAG: hypothetical protein AUF67_13890 [Acidobacteria bacterium 13_1_20CM_58_21]|nr:MAG: hypothetical protein AUF67_13890 [Acidobacteria bacterium 13_1_20CM_58_21]
MGLGGGGDAGVRSERGGPDHPVERRGDCDCGRSSHGAGADGNVALVAPAGTGTLVSTLATAVLLLESGAPPAGAGPLNVIVPLEEFPPVTLVGLSASKETERVGGGEDGPRNLF